MNKKSFFKKLLAIGVGAACVATGALFAACSDKDKDKDNDEDPAGPGPVAGHTHQWSTGNEATAWGSNGTHHWRLCLADGHGTQGATDAEGYGTHVYDDAQDTSCNTCGYTRTITPGGPSEGEDPVELTYNILKIEDITDSSIAVGGSVGTDLGLKVANDAAAISTNDGDPYTSAFNGTSLSLSKRLNLNGAINGSSGAKACIEVKPTENATIFVYAYSGGSSERYLALYETATPSNVNSDCIENTKQSIGDGTGTTLGVAKFVVEKDKTYYIGSTGSGINIYAIGFVTGGDVTETVASSATAKAPSCTEEGNIAYYVSNYGRYYSDSALTALVGPHAVIQSKVAHDALGEGGVCSMCGELKVDPGAASKTISVSATSAFPLKDSNEYVTVTSSGSFSVKEKAATASDNSELSFTHALLAGSNGGSFTVTAGANAVNVTLYLAVGDSNLTFKAETIGVDGGATVTASTSAVAHKLVISLAAGETVTIKCTSSTSRRVAFYGAIVDLAE